MDSTLSFVITNGLVAGHDVGFDSKDFEEVLQDLNCEEKFKFREEISLLIKDLSLSTPIRIDGSDSPQEEWIQEQENRFDKLFGLK